MTAFRYWVGLLSKHPSPFDHRKSAACRNGTKARRIGGDFFLQFLIIHQDTHERLRRLRNGKRRELVHDIGAMETDLIERRGLHAWEPEFQKIRRLLLIQPKLRKRVD